MTASELEIALDGKNDRSRQDRIRNWTRLGLLPTLGERCPGTGRARNYPAQALETLKVLEELAPLRIDFAGRERFVEKIVRDKKLFAAVRSLKAALVSA